MIKYFLTIICIIISICRMNAQEDVSLKGEFYLAPDFGLMLGTINQIEVSPALGYHISDRFSLAGGFKYEFYSQTRLYINQPPVKTHIYGPRAFARYTVIKNIGALLPIGINTSLFLHSDLESSNLERKYFDYPTNTKTGRFWYNTVLIGAGFSQAASERIQINIIVLWNTDTGYTTLYNNPIIRFGFQFYLRPKMQ